MADFIPDDIPGWKNTRTLPPTLVGQLCRLWSMENHLRHWAYAAAKLEFGNKWDQVVDPTTAPSKIKHQYDQIHKHRTNAKAADFPAGEIPPHFWFMSPNDLNVVIGENWASCYEKHLDGVPLSDLKVVFDELTRSRNPWAHFRPVEEAAFSARYQKYVTTLGPALAKWNARYWNAEDDFAGKEGLSEAYRRECPDGVPLLGMVPVGFHNPNVPIDRGLAIAFQESDIGHCWWATVVKQNLDWHWRLHDVVTIATAVAPFAVHTAVHYETIGEKAKFEDYAVTNVRVSFSKKDGPANFTEGLKAINKALTSCSVERTAIRDLDKISAGFVMDLLFYKAPWNVVVGPTQEVIEDWRVESSDG